MLDPSSSEDTGGESDPEVAQEPSRKPSAFLVAGKRGNIGRAGAQQLQSAEAGKGAKDSPSAGDDEERKGRDRVQKEEKERRTKLQIYVFVMRCISYPFNAKQPTDMARRQQKVTDHAISKDWGHYYIKDL
ncbi:hypothetical protein ATANTOWER_018573 [Ataeniobius toweri]|uniref:Uncharacterized protein n=1 Tax=Ataeniobius toweri TaxID=208326 RepID=A0ABU7AZD1_9TELE|nr:hypothetical protein [Ataeniobius toweri]